jgi:hypothetical protein
MNAMPCHIYNTCHIANDFKWIMQPCIVPRVLMGTFLLDINILGLSVSSRPTCMLYSIRKGFPVRTNTL